ncbi:LOW QUALITY PROTEIN: hypothetical protein CRUP_023769 [Coryphaenoides rupestris]|nr:LOW QUALITY PROTEIN: hypothetical protein CRUP_023769 [Coryphaenoides rupestris]
MLLCSIITTVTMLHQHHGLRHGLGQLNFSDGTCYTGQFENGLFNGCVVEAAVVVVEASVVEAGVVPVAAVAVAVVSAVVVAVVSAVVSAVVVLAVVAVAGEGLFEANQLVRRETSQGALQRAQGVAAKARALAK